MNNIWISLSTYGGVTTSEALAVFWAAGIRQVELAIGVKPSSDTVEVLRHYRQAGMQYRAHHAFVWEGQRSFNLAHRFDASYFECLTDWLAAMGIEAYSVHAGSFTRDGSFAVAEGNRAAACERFLDHLTQLEHLCRDRAIRLGVETMYPAHPEAASQYLLQTVAEIEQILHVMPHLQLVVDMAHLNLWQGHTIQEKLQTLELAPHRLLEVHISDNDGERDTHTSVSDTTWWVPYVARFPPDVPIVLESRMNRYSAEQVRQQVGRVQAILDRTTAHE